MYVRKEQFLFLRLHFVVVNPCLCLQVGDLVVYCVSSFDIHVFYVWITLNFWSPEMLFQVVYDVFNEPLLNNYV